MSLEAEIDSMKAKGEPITEDILKRKEEICAKFSSFFKERSHINIPINSLKMKVEGLLGQS